MFLPVSLPPKGFWFRVIWQTTILAAVLTPLWQTWAMSCTLAVAWADGRELVFLLRIFWLLCPLGLDAVKKERLGEENGRARCRFFNYGLCFSRWHQKLNRTRRWLKEGLPLRTQFTLLFCLNSRHIWDLMKD